MQGIFLPLRTVTTYSQYNYRNSYARASGQELHTKKGEPKSSPYLLTSQITVVMGSAESPDTHHARCYQDAQ